MTNPQPSSPQAALDSHVAGIVRRLNKITPLEAGGCAEEDAAAILDEAAGTTGQLVDAVALDLNDIEHKLTVLCRRLRADLGPTYSGEWLTYLLAESIRDDVHRTRNR